MKTEIKEIWIDALTSGEYKQCTGSLKKTDPDSYCCLGLLTELYRQIESKGEWDKDIGRSIQIDGRGYGGYLPAPVMEWADLKDEACRFGDKFQNNLAHENDNGKSFMEIAEIIFENF